MRELTREEIERENEILHMEKAHIQARYDHAIKILTAIHSATYPKVVEHEGKTFAFRPEDHHLFMQALSDRIRAIPDEIAKIEQAQPSHFDQASSMARR